MNRSGNHKIGRKNSCSLTQGMLGIYWSKSTVTMNRCLGADMMPAGLFTASRYSSSYNTCTATHMLTLMSLPELQACMR